LADLALPLKSGRILAIGLKPGSLLTDRLEITVRGDEAGCFDPRLNPGLNKLAVIERHRASGRLGLGVLSGYGLKNGAIAATVAHDAHNLMIVGMNEADMALAGNTLAECGGGMVAVLDGNILALLPLPIAGLLSEDEAPVIAEKVAKLDAAWKELGCDLESPFMTMALLPLAVLPELRLTNRGLIDTINYGFTELFI
jgi:adenine deaminase